MNEIISKLSLAGNKRPVTNKDMSQIENKLGIVIPDDMKAFYLCLNGTGVLGLDVECMFHSPITGLDYEISHFISFKYGGAQFTIDGGASIACIEENRASNLLVFAIAEDHSRFVIDVKTGNIYNYKHKEIKWYYTKEGRQIFFDVSTYDEQADNFWRTSSEPFRSEQAYYLGDKTLVAESFSEFILHLSVTVNEYPEAEVLPESRYTDFWGNVVYDKYEGFKTERKVEVLALNMDATVYVGRAYNDNGEEITTPPTMKKLEEYEQTLRQFLDNTDLIVSQIMEKAYKYYKKNYAHYYEKEFEVLFPNEMVMPSADSKLHSPLCITTPAEHLRYMTYNPCKHIRILPRKTIIIPINYALDEEHGMEIKIVDGKVKSIGESGNYE